MTNSRIKKGFTLIELLVVIAIIGVLASVVLASLNTARRKSRDARRVADIKQIQLALEMEFDDAQEYPDALSTLQSNGFIAVVPTDPTTGTAYAYSNLNWVSGVREACSGASTCTFYHLGALLEDTANNTLDTDRDLDTVVDGSPDGISATAACAADAVAEAATDRCYDVTP